MVAWAGLRVLKLDDAKKASSFCSNQTFSDECVHDMLLS
jgi:hypothetical protein